MRDGEQIRVGRTPTWMWRYHITFPWQNTLIRSWQAVHLLSMVSKHYKFMVCLMPLCSYSLKQPPLLYATLAWWGFANADKWYRHGRLFSNQLPNQFAISATLYPVWMPSVNRLVNNYFVRWNTHPFTPNVDCYHLSNKSSNIFNIAKVVQQIIWTRHTHIYILFPLPLWSFQFISII